MIKDKQKIALNHAITNLYTCSNLKHGDYNPSTKLFYNAYTNKWVQRLRPSLKGGVHKKKLESIKAIEGKEVKLYGWIPASLTLSDIEQIMDNYNQQHFGGKWKWNLDRAIAVTTLITIRYYWQKKKARDVDGWVQISREQFKKWVHSHDYTYYIMALEKATIIQTPMSLSQGC